MKKTEIILIAVVVILFLTVISSAILLRERKPTTVSPPPIQVFSPSPKPPSSPSISENLEEERIKQENYAKAREEFFQTHPWALKIPLKSDNYFISYNPETDTLLVELYYLSEEEFSKEQQLAQARQDALQAMTEAGIDTSKQKIDYLELVKKQ